MKKKVNCSSISIIQKDNVIIAVRGDCKGIAKCNPEDTFDAGVGTKLAIARLLEAEQDVIKEGDNYFFVDIDGYILASTIYRRVDLCALHIAMHNLCELHIAMHNCFRTREAAVAKRDEIMTKWKKVITFANTLR